MKILERISLLWQRMRLISGRTKWIAIATAAVLTLTPILYFWRDVTRTFTDASRRSSEADKVVVSSAPLTKAGTSGIALMLSRSHVRGIADFQGRHFAATSGGLIALDDDGAVDKSFSVLDGLPENDLRTVAVYQDRLFIGTSNEGLLSYDGARFTRYEFKQPRASQISILYPAQTELLIGTMDEGLFEFDGQNFTQRYQKNQPGGFRSVTALFAKESRVYVGTQENGLYVCREGAIDHFTRAEGLPSDRVTAITRALDEVVVATDFGVVTVSSGNEVKPFNPAPNVTSLVVLDGRLYAGLLTEGVAELRRDQRPVPVGNWSTNPFARIADRTAASIPRDVRLSILGGSLWAGTANGIYQFNGTSAKPFALQQSNDQLGHQHVTSLAFDWAGRLWVGYFDGGVDVIGRDTLEIFTHLQDDALREVNFLRLDRERERMLVATSAGLVIFDSRLLPKRLSERDGLISDSISHIELAPGLDVAGTGAGGQAVVVATGKGLTFLAGSVPRSISAFNGLASNYVYTALAARGKLFAGTLGGLSEIDRMRVTRTYTRSNSALLANWVTALASADGILYVGTNGGGVQALTPSGEWTDFRDEVGKFTVNSNAMVFDGNRLLVGTPDRGVLIFNTQTREWSSLAASLGSRNVTSITADSGYFYFGTANGVARVERRLLGS